jgi:hypothetical protein
MKVPGWVEDPSKFKTVNGWLTVIWFVLAFPICIFLSQSVPFLVFISVYAVVTGHLATWQAARVEERQELDADVDEALQKLEAVQTQLDRIHRKLR